MAWPHEVQTELQAFYGKFQLGANGTPTETWNECSLRFWEFVNFRCELR